MSFDSTGPGWAAVAVLAARLIFAALFIMAVAFKVIDIDATAAQIAAAGFVYVVFLGVAFHGPDRWAENQSEFGFFIDHFTFMAGLLYAAAHGPGRWLTVRRAAATAQ